MSSNSNSNYSNASGGRPPSQQQPPNPDGIVPPPRTYRRSTTQPLPTATTQPLASGAPSPASSYSNVSGLPPMSAASYSSQSPATGTTPSSSYSSSALLTPASQQQPNYYSQQPGAIPPRTDSTGQSGTKMSRSTSNMSRKSSYNDLANVEAGSFSDLPPDQQTSFGSNIKRGKSLVKYERAPSERRPPVPGQPHAVLSDGPTEFVIAEPSPSFANGQVPMAAAPRPLSMNVPTAQMMQISGQVSNQQGQGQLPQQQQVVGTRPMSQAYYATPPSMPISQQASVSTLPPLQVAAAASIVGNGYGQASSPIQQGTLLGERPIPGSEPQPPRTSSKAKSVNSPDDSTKGPPLTWWRVIVMILTFWAIRPLLSCCGLKTRDQQDAWREKVALVIIILLLCTAVGFLTFGFTQTVCGRPAPRIQGSQLAAAGATAIHGRGISTDGYTHPVSQYGAIDLWTWSVGRDIGFLFPPFPEQSVCRKVLGDNYTHWPCTIPGVWPRQAGQVEACHYTQEARDVVANQLRFQGDVFFDWAEISATAPPIMTGQVTVSDPLYIVYNGMVLNIFRMLAENPDFLGAKVKREVIFNLGRDATLSFTSDNDLKMRAECLVEIFKVGVVDPKTVGCVVSDVVLYVSLVFIVAVVLIKFILAVAYHWCLSRRLGDASAKKRPTKGLALQRPGQPSSPSSTSAPMLTTTPAPLRTEDSTATIVGSPTPSNLKVEVVSPDSISVSESNLGAGRSENSLETDGSANTTTPMVPALLGYGNGSEKQVPEKWRSDLMYTILMVTCYSEGEESIRQTLDSLALTDYPDERKLLLVVCDGIVKGAGNDKSTPDIVTNMITPAPEALAPLRFPDPPPALSYVAIADGSRRLNCARVHAGYYRHALETEGRKVPIVVIVKVGNPEEQQQAAEGKGAKPGNRGKRDSQIVVMNFLSKVIFDDRLTDFEYDLFSKIWSLGGVPPDQYEAIMFVDADTKVFPDSLRHKVATFMRDPNIMGLCGETKIENKTDSWVTMIQVFEYHISHNLNKAFESVFGGVTCLPGCFSMYRIKAPKGPEGYYVPILANPDVVEKYAENVVDTLHKKNLLLLGEDRYLTTLMLKIFPRRKLLFVPQAKCKTTVPDRFKVLLSQRRRWINSTVHNLLELVLVRDLCGTFCISMQFVVFMELIGTLVLPAAICFTIYLLIISFFTTPPPIIPLALLVTILGLPAVLIVITAQSITYVFWMFIYILSLPIWNFVLPIYAYWHFDDFSWGQTRMVAGDTSKGHAAKSGDFDGSGIIMRRWVEWERFEREKLAADLMGDMNQMAIRASKNNVLLRPFDQDQYVAAAIEQAENQVAAKDRAKKTKKASSLDEARLKTSQNYSTTGSAGSSRAPPRESWLLQAGNTVSLTSPQQTEMSAAPTTKPLR